MSKSKKTNRWEEQPDQGWRDLQERAVAEASRQRLRPKTKGQEFYFKMVETSTVTLCVGPAGTGKTYLACGIGAQMLREGRVRQIVVARPLVGCDEDTGYLPGGIDEKVGPFVQHLLDAFGDFLTPREIENYRHSDALQVVPLAFMRGRTFRDSFVILDEAQNATYRQLLMFLTRFGENSRVVVNGDAKQSDLDKRAGSPLLEVMSRLNHPDIARVYLTKDDIVRHGLVRYIVETLNE